MGEKEARIVELERSLGEISGQKDQELGHLRSQIEQLSNSQKVNNKQKQEIVIRFNLIYLFQIGT